jgi:hypothetical protein
MGSSIPVVSVSPVNPATMGISILGTAAVPLAALRPGGSARQVPMSAALPSPPPLLLPVCRMWQWQWQSMRAGWDRSAIRCRACSTGACGKKKKKNIFSPHGRCFLDVCLPMFLIPHFFKKMSNVLTIFIKIRSWDNSTLEFSDSVGGAPPLTPTATTTATATATAVDGRCGSGSGSGSGGVALGMGTALVGCVAFWFFTHFSTLVLKTFARH